MDTPGSQKWLMAPSNSRLAVPHVVRHIWRWFMNDHKGEACGRLHFRAAHFTGKWLTRQGMDYNVPQTQVTSHPSNTGSWSVVPPVTVSTFGHAQLAASSHGPRCTS